MTAATSVWPAPAKLNLFLHILGRRPDGYHEIESLVVFAAVGDALAFTPGKQLDLAVRGPTAVAAGDIADNLRSTRLGGSCGMARNPTQRLLYDGSDGSAKRVLTECPPGLMSVCTENLNPDVVVMKSAKDRV